MGKRTDSIVHGQNEYFMRGHYNFLDLRDQIFSSFDVAPKNVVLAGMSAGGLAVMHHCDQFNFWLNNVRFQNHPEINVKCVSDGSWFVDISQWLKMDLKGSKIAIFGQKMPKMTLF